MSVTLEEALAQVQLEAGRTYRCKVNGRDVLVRVLQETPKEWLPAPLVESDIMLDAWVEFPPSKGGVIVKGRPGPAPLPDPLILPPEDEEV